MKQALEALEQDNPLGRSATITALRTAIAEAERQEPVGEVLNERGDVDYLSYVPPAGTPLYTTPPAAPVQEPVACKTLCELCVKRGYTFCANAVKTTPINTPPQRKPLTDEEIDDIWNRYCDEMGEASINDAYDIARAIEAKLKEKNT